MKGVGGMNKLKSERDLCPEKAYEIFFNALKEDGIKPLIKAAARLYGRPVLLTDENYRLLYQYPERKLGQNIWDDLYDHGALPPETVWEYQQAFLNGTQKTYEPFYADWGLTEEFPRIFGEVYTSDDRILGHIAIFMMGDSLGPYDLEVAKIFVDALQIKMSGKTSTNTTNSRYLFDLLSKDTSFQAKTLAISTLTKKLKGDFRLMVTPLGKSAAQKAYAHTAVNRLASFYRNTVSTIYENCIVTLFGEMKANDHEEKERAFLNSVADSLKISYSGNGISSMFTELSEITGRYQQAYYSVMLYPHQTSFYEDVAPEPLFMMLTASMAVDAFTHPTLSEIYQYDQVNGTEYFKTLETYSLLMHDKDSSAKQLCIHRNTLLYRLNRINEIFHLSYEDSKTALHLLNSFQLWNIHLKLVKKEDKEL